MSGLKGLLGLLSLLNTLFELYKKWQLKREVQAEVNDALAKKEADVLRKATDIVAERRTDDDTAGRMHGGTF